MAGKRKSKRAESEDLAKPSKWRLQHGGFSGPIREADPETGTPVAHRRAVDTLGLMLANDTITPEMHDAGEVFRGLFRSAAFDGMSTSQIPRIPGTRVDAISTLQVEARRRVAAASRRLGAERAAAGGDGIDADMAKGLAFAFLVKALARHSVVAWEGVGDRRGAPLDPTPENVERLMDLDDVAAAFWDGATLPVASVAVEGNASGPAPNGISDAGPSTAAAAQP